MLEATLHEPNTRSFQSNRDDKDLIF